MFSKSLLIYGSCKSYIKSWFIGFFHPTFWLQVYTTVVLEAWHTVAPGPPVALSAEKLPHREGDSAASHGPTQSPSHGRVRPPGPPGQPRHKKKEEKVVWEKETWLVWFIVGFYVSIQYMYAVYTYRCKCWSYTHAPVVPKDPQNLWLTSRYFSSSFFSNFLSWGPWSYNPKKWPYKCVTGVTTPTYRVYNPMYTWEKNLDHSRSPSLAGVFQGNDLALVLGNDRKSSCNCRSCRNTPYLSCGWKIFHLL